MSAGASSGIIVAGGWLVGFQGGSVEEELPRCMPVATFQRNGGGLRVGGWSEDLDSSKEGRDLSFNSKFEISKRILATLATKDGLSVRR